MAKDPSVSFYTSDFLSGTSFFTYEQRGQYITLLCQQHQLDLIPENHMISVCGSLDNPVIKKFVRTAEGFYYNERMREEKERRRKYCDSRSHENAGRPKVSKKQNHTNTIRLPYGNRIENENENENEVVNKVFQLYVTKTNRPSSFKLTTTRHKIILSAIKEGRTIEQFEQALDAFLKDDWPDRHKYMDLIYVWGTRNHVNNFDKWLSKQSKTTSKLPPKL